MAWLYLVLVSVFEVGFTTLMWLSGNFKNLLAVGGFVVCVLLSLLFLELANRSILLGTAYVIWTGVGATGTVVIGMPWFGESVSITWIALILGIVVCAISLKLTSGD